MHLHFQLNLIFHNVKKSRQLKMFFEVEKIEEIFKCSSCGNRIDIPKILPCGNTLCSRCADHIITSSQKVEMQIDTILFKDDVTFDKIKEWFICNICNSKHQIPKNGFPTQKIVLELLQLKQKKIYRSGLFNKAEILVEQFKDNISNLNKMVQEPTGYLHQHCESVRSKISDLTKNRIDELNFLRETLINEVNLYEENKLNNKNINEHISVKDFIENCEMKIIELKRFFGKAEITNSEEEVGHKIKEINLLNSRILNELKSFEKNVFDSEKISLADSSEILRKNVICELRYKKI